MKKFILLVLLAGMVAAWGQTDGYWNVLPQDKKYWTILDYASGWVDCAYEYKTAGVENKEVAAISLLFSKIIKGGPESIYSLIAYLDIFYSKEANYSVSLFTAISGAPL